MCRLRMFFLPTFLYLVCDGHIPVQQTIVSWLEALISLLVSHHVRSFVSVCLQENVLYPDMTVSEHFKLFGAIKGVTNQHDMLTRVGLAHREHALASELSGGEARRLCLGLALLGDSKVVLLDEPTSGVDPAGREMVRDLLIGQKKGRVIVVTTHMMDEAERLADRIAIMAHGRLKTHGEWTWYFSLIMHLSLFIRTLLLLSIFYLAVSSSFCLSPQALEHFSFVSFLPSP